MIIARLFDRETTEPIMGWKCKSLTQLKERIVTLFKDPESLLIMVEGMNPFLFIDFDVVLGEDEHEEIEITTKTQLEYAVQWLEQRHRTFQTMKANLPATSQHEESFQNGVEYAAKCYDQSIKELRQLLDGFMVEDVNFDEMESEEHVS
jgi:hypothetical protein